jgi:hypothetical protein
MDSASHIQKKMKRKEKMGEVDLLSLPGRPAITASKAFTHITYTQSNKERIEKPSFLIFVFFFILRPH